MKLFTLFLCLISMSTVAGLPPTTLVGNDSGESNLFFKLNVPNAQSTKLADGAIIETGNENILANPSFESNRSTTGYAWSVSGATASLDTTNQIHGKNALSLALSSTLNLNQSAATNVANTVGLQAVASVYIKSSLADVNVCSIINSVEDKCVLYNGTNTWVKIEIPFIFGATQNGIKVKTTSSTTGTVLVDNAFVGLSSPFQNVSGAKLVGTITISGCTSTFNLTSSTFTDFGANTNCVYTTTGSAVADTSFGTTQIPSIKFASLPAGDYSIQVEGSFYQSNTNQNGYLRISDGTNISKETSEFTSSAGGIIVPSINHTISYSTTQSNVTLKLQGASTSSNLSIYANGTLGNSTGSSSRHLTFKVYYFPPESKIYSQASQDVAYQPCTFSTLAWQGLGTVTNNLLCARKGQNLLIKGRLTLGTVAAAQAQIPLPTNFGTITTASNIPSTSYASGFVLREASSANTIYSLIQLPSVSYLAMAGQLGNTTISPNSPLNGSTMFSNGDILSIPEIAIPIQGWQDYGVIVGSFQYVPQVPGQSNVDVFSVSYGTGNATTVCSASPCSYLSQIGNAVSSITRSGTGSYVINFNKTYSNLKCIPYLDTPAFQGAAGLTSNSSPSCSSCNSLPLNTGKNNVGNYDTTGTLYCQGSY